MFNVTSKFWFCLIMNDEGKRVIWMCLPKLYSNFICNYKELFSCFQMSDWVVALPRICHPKLIEAFRECFYFDKNSWGQMSNCYGKFCFCSRKCHHVTCVKLCPASNTKIFQITISVFIWTTFIMRKRCCKYRRLSWNQ